MGQGLRAKSIDIASILKDVLRQCWLIVLFAVSVGLLANTFAKVRYVPRYTTKLHLLSTRREQTLQCIPIFQMQ